MIKKFKKAMTVLAAVAMTSATIGAGLAASYPEPFTSNSAVVTGLNANSSDNIAAGLIIDNLNAASSASSDSSSGSTSFNGETYKLEKSSTFFHLGDTMTSVVSATIDDDELPTLLASGTYLDDNNDEFDFDQEITLPATQLTMFADNDYNDDEPTVGIKYNNGDTVLTYTLDFTEEPSISLLDTTDMVIMGKTYYVLSSDFTLASPKITLLDSAATTLVSEGETKTITAGGKTYTVSLEFIDSDSVKFNVNGELTNDIGLSQTYRLDNNAYIGVKEILYTSKDTGISKAEFSIGSGKLVLQDGQDVELNDDTLTDMTASVVNDSTGTTLSSIGITWAAEDDAFVTESQSVSMPGFGSVSVAFKGLDYPAEEEIAIKPGSDEYMQLSNFPLKDSTEDIDLFYSNVDSNLIQGIGKDSTNKLITGADNTNVTFDKDTDKYLVVSWTDGNDAESYLLQFTDFKTESTIDKVTVQQRKDNNWVDVKTDRKNGQTISLGNAEIRVWDISNTNNNLTVEEGNSQTDFHTLYSKEGMKLLLPVEDTSLTSTATSAAGGINLNGTYAVTSFDLQTYEEDKDDNIGSGGNLTLTLGYDASNETSVTTIPTSGYTTRAGEQEIGSTDVFRDFIYSALATEIKYDKNQDQREVTLIYHGSEVKADVRLAASTAVSNSGDDTSTGVLTFKDDEKASFEGMNLVVVGGSAINAIAAELLGGAYAGSEFTAQTGVADGEFLIQSFDRSGKTALLVAGYNAVDTTKAVNYLLNNDVTTDIGTKYKGSDATTAAVVTA